MQNRAAFFFWKRHHPTSGARFAGICFFFVILPKNKYLKLRTSRGKTRRRKSCFHGYNFFLLDLVKIFLDFWMLGGEKGCRFGVSFLLVCNVHDFNKQKIKFYRILVMTNFVNDPSNSPQLKQPAKNEFWT